MTLVAAGQRVSHHPAARRPGGTGRTAALVAAGTGYWRWSVPVLVRPQVVSSEITLINVTS